MTNLIKKQEEELVNKFKSPLGNSSIDNKFNSMYDLEDFMSKVRKESIEFERERIRKILIDDLLIKCKCKNGDCNRCYRLKVLIDALEL